MKYVEPELVVFESLTNTATRRFLSKRVDLAAVLKETRAFVIGDPGYGKSRLLRELAARASTAGQHAVVADLRDVPRLDRIAEFLVQRDVDFEVLRPNSSVENARLLRTNRFTLPAGPAPRPRGEPEGRVAAPPLVCLDALDELAPARTSSLRMGGVGGGLRSMWRSSGDDDLEHHAVERVLRSGGDVDVGWLGLQLQVERGLKRKHADQFLQLQTHSGATEQGLGA